MKKRILSILLMSALVMSMAGCGKKTDTAQTTENTETTTAAEKEDTAAETTTAAVEKEDAAEEITTTAPKTEEITTTEAPKEVQKITNEPKITNDCMIFDIDDKNYVYNMADNKMYEYGDEVSISGAYGKLAVTSERFYNLETKEYYEGNCFISYIYEYNPVYKLEESFDGDTYYFGIIDKNGEWVLPLSSEYAICEYKLGFGSRFSATSSLLYWANPSGALIAYDYKNDKIINGDELGKGIISCSNDNLLIGSSYGAGVYNNISAYNVNTNENISIYEDDANCYNTPLGGSYLVNHEDEYLAVFGENFEINHEITGYKGTYVYNATENYVAFQSWGADSSTYIIILDKDGNRVIEPIGCEAYDEAIYMSGDYTTISNLDYYDANDNLCTGDCIINCKTGEIKEYTDEETYDIIAGCNENGKIVVKANGAYYLADPANPDTLINPFEIAE